MRTVSIAALSAALLAASAPAALAVDGLPGATVRADSGKPAAERRTRFEQWCRENPEKCKEIQARRQQCKADPEKCRAELQARREDRFKRADANGDGKLTREEAQKGMPGLARHFDRIDVNKDGAVTTEELRAARSARGGPRKAPGGSLKPGAAVQS